MTLFDCLTAGIPVHIVSQDNGSSSNVGDVSLCLPLCVCVCPCVRVVIYVINIYTD